MEPAVWGLEPAKPGPGAAGRAIGAGAIACGSLLRFDLLAPPPGRSHPPSTGYDRERGLVAPDVSMRLPSVLTRNRWTAMFDDVEISEWSMLSRGAISSVVSGFDD